MTLPFFLMLLLIISLQYVGTFAVSLGTGGEGKHTLKTHKERTEFVKKQLNEYQVG